VPTALADQLAIGGIMIIPLQEGLMNQELVRITRDEKGFGHEHLLPVRFVPLVEGVARES
jgi:protein-L-isoaspartate(D-aspartate) O-methyltransferase